MEALLAILLPLVAQLIHEYLKFKSEQRKVERKTIDEALVKGDTAMLDAALDDQHYRVSEAIRRHTSKE